MQHLHLQDRWRRIIKEVDGSSSVTIQELSSKLNTSETTIRRDLTDLDRMGIVTRVRGGATKLCDESPRPFPPAPGLSGKAAAQYAKPAPEFTAVQKAIANRALAFITAHSTVVLAGEGPSRALAAAMGAVTCRVMTASIRILSALLAKPSLQLTLPDGELIKDRDVVLSPYDSKIINNFYASRIFISPRALSLRGLMHEDPLLVQVDRALIARASEVIVLIESSAINDSCHFCVCPLEKVQTIITDSKIDPALLAKLSAQGVQVLVV